MSNYLVSDIRNNYSVPYNLIGEKVDIHMTKTTGEVFYYGNQVASHLNWQSLLLADSSGGDGGFSPVA